MKRRTEVLSDRTMRFFTPELYIRFNSQEEGEADRADEDWESALGKYRKHLDGIRTRMPSQVRELSELCLHDGVWLSSVPMSVPSPAHADSDDRLPAWSVMAVLSVMHEGKIVSLVYQLWDKLVEHAQHRDWRFSPERIHWLYDEVDLAPNSKTQFVHRILLSNGKVVEVPFQSVFLHVIPLSTIGEAEPARQSA